MTGVSSLIGVVTLYLTGAVGELLRLDADSISSPTVWPPASPSTASRTPPDTPTPAPPSGTTAAAENSMTTPHTHSPPASLLTSTRRSLTSNKRRHRGQKVTQSDRAPPWRGPIVVRVAVATGTVLSV